MFLPLLGCTAVCCLRALAGWRIRLPSLRLRRPGPGAVVAGDAGRLPQRLDFLFHGEGDGPFGHGGGGEGPLDAHAVRKPGEGPILNGRGRVLLEGGAGARHGDAFIGADVAFQLVGELGDGGPIFGELEDDGAASPLEGQEPDEFSVRLGGVHYRI